MFYTTLNFLNLGGLCSLKCICSSECMLYSTNLIYCMSPQSTTHIISSKGQETASFAKRDKSLLPYCYQLENPISRKKKLQTIFNWSNFEVALLEELSLILVSLVSHLCSTSYTAKRQATVPFCVVSWHVMYDLLCTCRQTRYSANLHRWTQMMC